MKLPSRHKCLQNVKRFVLSGFLPGLLATLCASGCGGSGEPADGKVHLQFSTWGSAQEMTVTRSLVAEFERTHPNIKVEIIHIPDNYDQKLHILIAGGIAPDVMFINSIEFPVYALPGVFLDLNPLIQEHAKDPDAVSASHFYDGSLKAFTWYNDKGQPSLEALPRDISDLVVFYNKDLFRAAGLDAPTANWNWDEFVSDAQKLTIDRDKDGRIDQFGVSFYDNVNPQGHIYWMPFVWSAGGDIFSPDYKELTLTEDHALAGIQFYAALRNYYHVAPTKIESGASKMSDLFLQQKLGMLVSGRWSVPFLREKAPFQWDVAPLPVGPGGYSRTGIDASGYAIASSTRHPEESYELIAFLESQPALTTVTQSGLIVPARKDVAESPVFLDNRLAPAHSRVFLDALEYGVPTRTSPRWNEISEVLGLALEPVWDGDENVSAQQALEKVKPEVDRMLEIAR